MLSFLWSPWEVEMGLLHPDYQESQLCGSASHLYTWCIPPIVQRSSKLYNYQLLPQPDCTFESDHLFCAFWAQPLKCTGSKRCLLFFFKGTPFFWNAAIKRKKSFHICCWWPHFQHGINLLNILSFFCERHHLHDTVLNICTLFG